MSQVTGRGNWDRWVHKEVELSRPDTRRGSLSSHVPQSHTCRETTRPVTTTSLGFTPSITLSEPGTPEVSTPGHGHFRSPWGRDHDESEIGFVR